MTIQVSRTRTLVICAMLIALDIILTRYLSITAATIRIGFSFMPIFVAGWFFGAIPAAVVAVGADILGMFIAGNGVFYPGFTLTFLIQGIVFGLIFRSGVNIKKIILTVFIHQVCLGMFLNTYWLLLYYADSYQGTTYFALLATRLPQYAVNIPVELATMFILSKALTGLRKGVISGA